MNMLSQTTHRLLLTAIIALPVIGIVSQAQAQRITYKEIEVKRTINEPVTKTRWVEKKTFETDLETRQKQVVQTEKRQRVVITQKPVVETKYRTEKIKRQKPVTVKKFRERRTKQTTYKTVTGYRDETETIREPVIETETTLKPVVKKETQYDVVPGQTLYSVLPDASRRSRVRWLSPGYYTDPVSGLSVYRGRGLHWVQPNATVPVGQTAGVTVPREVENTTYEPEVVETRRPVSVTRMVEETIEREVPHEVKKFVERTVTKKVPYEYKMPVDKVVVEKIPYTETVYEEEVIERRVPYTETRMQEVRTIEDYEVEVPRYVAETVKKEKPVYKWVEEEFETTVQRTVYETMKVPCTADGEPVSDPVPLGAREYEFVSELPSTGTSTTRKPISPKQQQVYETQGRVKKDSTITAPTKTRKPASIIFPETKSDRSTSERTKMGLIVEAESTATPSAQSPQPLTTPKAVVETSGAVRRVPEAEMPASGLSPETGNEKAAD